MGSVIAVIQARMSSSRFPGKSLAKVYKNLSLLEMVLMRVLKAEKLDSVILATSKDKNCDPLEETANRLGVVTIRGSETDVLSRFEKTVKQFKPDAVVRICADNPLVDPGEIDKLVLFFGMNDFDNASNNAPECGLPDGLGGEIVKADVLLNAAGAANEQIFREHVTNYITSHSDKFSVGRLMAEPQLLRPELKLDINTKTDLKKMQKFCSSLPEKNAPYWTAYEIVMNAELVYGL
ncbi:MAG: hypothetical protein HY806_05290 [Nitrospirae bacterium]|nr:hypothetical protein [Nitrospirota bacterium]